MAEDKHAGHYYYLETQDQYYRRIGVDPSEDEKIVHNATTDCNSINEGEYIVESIVGKRISRRVSPNNEVQYLVKWKNFRYSENTWEPLCHVTNSLELVDEFEERCKDEIAEINHHISVCSKRRKVGRPKGKEKKEVRRPNIGLKRIRKLSSEEEEEEEEKENEIENEIENENLFMFERGRKFQRVYGILDENQFVVEYTSGEFETIPFPVMRIIYPNELIDFLHAKVEITGRINNPDVNKDETSNTVKPKQESSFNSEETINKSNSDTESKRSSLTYSSPSLSPVLQERSLRSSSPKPVSRSPSPPMKRTSKYPSIPRKRLSRSPSRSPTTSQSSSSEDKSLDYEICEPSTSTASLASLAIEYKKRPKPAQIIEIDDSD